MEAKDTWDTWDPFYRKHWHKKSQQERKPFAFCEPQSCFIRQRAKEVICTLLGPHEIIGLLGCQLFFIWSLNSSYACNNSSLLWGWKQMNPSVGECSVNAQKQKRGKWMSAHKEANSFMPMNACIQKESFTQSGTWMPQVPSLPITLSCYAEMSWCLYSHTHTHRHQLFANPPLLIAKD